MTTISRPNITLSSFSICSTALTQVINAAKNISRKSILTLAASDSTLHYQSTYPSFYYNIRRIPMSSTRVVASSVFLLKRRFSSTLFGLRWIPLILHSLITIVRPKLTSAATRGSLVSLEGYDQCAHQSLGPAGKLVSIAIPSC